VNLSEIVALLRRDYHITDEERAEAAAELERVQVILEDLETKPIVRPSMTGESASRAVQKLAAEALHGVAR
jgi:hypothetical protein